MHIGIIGGGLTGCLLAVHLLRKARTDIIVTLIESAEALGRGLAYGTDNPDHVLNVRAGNMGAFDDDPQHFYKWLSARDGETSASAFASRRTYGDYVADLFGTYAADNLSRLSIVRASATALHGGAQPAVSLVGGRRLVFDRLALCFGNLPAAMPPNISKGAIGSGHYLHDPWAAGAYRAIAADAPVLIIGSGLTMADVVQSLVHQGHTGPIDVISRHGLLPLRHEASRPLAIAKPQGRLLDMFRSVRRAAKGAAASGHDWRDVIDALRPWTRELWRASPLRERQQFLRHLRAYWDVHRHRLAPDVADELAGLRRTGRFTVAAGRVGRIDWQDGRFDVEVMARRGAPERLSPAWIVNCTGPEGDYRRAANPFVRSAIAEGIIRPDSLRLGLDVTDEGAVIDAKGAVSSTLFALGPPTRGVFWEITSVPDIRRACARMAEVLVRTG